MDSVRRLTRRDVLAGAVVAGAGMLVPASASGHVPGPDTRLFSRQVGALRAGQAITLRPGRPFCLAAVRWRAPAHGRVQLRTRLADGRWGAWVQTGACGHDGDGVRAGGHVGEGVWTGRSLTLQLRSAGGMKGVSVDLVADVDDGEGGVGALASAAAAPAPAGPVLDAGPGQPPIIARHVWAGTRHPPVHPPQYGSIRMGILHHTENANGYSAGEVPAMLRAIYAFHVHGRGWFDIGYNFVVDRFGRIWEARQGGIDLPVMGAQAGDWNQISFGVSMLGTYADVLPSGAALSAVEHLIAWKLALSGLPAIGEISEVVPAAEVGFTQFRAGEHVRFPRVAGHRDVDATECPGDDLYGHLPRMRPRIARLEGRPPTLELFGEIAATVGESFLNLSGRLAGPDGVGLADAPVAIQTVVGAFGHTRTLASASTDDAGRFTAVVTPAPGMIVRALHAARPASASALLVVGPSAAGGSAGALVCGAA